MEVPRTPRRREIVPVRAAWLAAFLLAIFLLATGLPYYFREVGKICLAADGCSVYEQLTGEGLTRLQLTGVSLGRYALYMTLVVGATAVSGIAISTLLAWRGWFDPVTLRFAVLVVLLTMYVPSVDSDFGIISFSFLVVSLQAGAMLLFFWLFPDGIFTPSWMRWIFLGWSLGVVLRLFPGEPLNIIMYPLLDGLSWFLPLFSAIGAAVYRYLYRSTAVQRQQTKILLLPVTILLVLVVPLSVTQPEPGSVLFLFERLLNGLLVVAIPVSIGFAVLKYRLFDIDVIIRKTLLYGALSVALGLIYFGTVLLLQTLFTTTFGDRPPFILVSSTLLVAALFSPLRSRLQEAIDRRFYRRKYDAAQALAHFAAAARDEVELNALCTALMQAVQETLQPAAAAIWLLPAPSANPQRDLS